MSDDSPISPARDDDIGEWVPSWHTRWHVLLGALLVGVAVLVHGSAAEQLEDALTGGLLLGLAVWAWYRRDRGQFSLTSARVGGLLGLWLVTATLLWDPHWSLLMVGSLGVGVVLLVTDTLFYNLLKTL